ncbi:division/cell wall cluster transcriptional repressor MraZ [Ideonella sp.]|uniref:division/cell wall cluster transcriptional repressor MraZ n=1 Tax=Ideonella sp. TaxID=1929293 RepID=UPI003BB816B4
MLQGESELTLDGKGRVAVPARFREALAGLCEGKLTVTKHPTRCLLLFPRPAWIDFRTKLLGLPMDVEAWRRIYLGSAMDVEVDGGARILLSPELRKWAGLDRELTLVGMGSRMEIWDRSRYLALEEATLASPMPESLRNMVM